MSLEQVGLQIGTGALIGYTTGWGLKKLIRVVIKIVVIILAAFFGALMWLNVQKIVTVNWNELENQTRNSLEWVINAIINNDYSTHTLNQIMSNFGLSFAAPMGLAFVAGFMKG